MTNAVSYSLEDGLSSEEFIDVLIRSGLSERRPIGEADTIAGMLAHANVLLAARTVGGLLIGISRAITDYSYCTYLSDLAIDVEFQGLGIGRELVRRTHEAAGLHTSLILLSAPKAQTYYPHIGMRRHESCWLVDRIPAAAASSRRKRER